LITLAKVATVANRRVAFDRLRDRDIVTKLFNELGPRYQARPGGYLRILKFGLRQGDAAPMALAELVDRPTSAGAEASERAKQYPFIDCPESRASRPPFCLYDHVVSHMP